MLDFQWEPKTIRELESHYAKSLPEILGAFLDMAHITMFVKKGLKVSEPETDTILLSYMKENNKDTLEIQYEIMQSLEEQGFLAKVLQMAKAVEENVKILAAEMRVKPSESTGEKEKPAQ